MMASTNPNNPEFDVETLEYSKDLRITTQRESSRALKSTRNSSSSFMHFAHFDQGTPIPFRFYFHKESNVLYQKVLPNKQGTLFQYCSNDLLDSLSWDSSRTVFPVPIPFRSTFTTGLRGGSQFQPSQRNFASEKDEKISIFQESKEIPVSSEYEEKLTLLFKEILGYLEMRNSASIPLDGLDEFNQTNICPYEGVLRALSTDLSASHLEMLMRIARIRKSEFTVASANSISILNYAQYSFEKENLRGIFIEGADLRGADLRRADLSGSKMKRANLIGAHLEFSNLGNCDLSQVEFSNLEFEDRDFTTIFAVSFSTDGRLIASENEDRSVTVWDLRTFELIGSLSGYSSKMHALSFSPDGRLLASTSIDSALKVFQLKKHGFSLFNILF